VGRIQVRVDGTINALGRFLCREWTQCQRPPRNNKLEVSVPQWDRKTVLRIPIQNELMQRGGTIWTEVLDIQDSGLRRTIDAECTGRIKTQLEIVENYFIFTSFQDYLAAYSMCGPRIFSFYNSKVDKLRTLVSLL
jgi:hypothetical protein